MKFNEWITGVVQPLFKKKEEADLFASASSFKDIDIPDEVAAQFSNVYLTRERALTDEQIVKKFNVDARGRVFDSVDLKLKKLLPKLKQEDQDAINAEQNTLLKMEMLDKALDNIASKPAEDVEKVNAQWRKKEEEWHQKIKDQETVIKEKDSNFAKQVKEVQLDYALKNKMRAFELAPGFDTEKHRNFLADSTISSLKKNFVLEFDEKDPSIIHLRKNVDGQITDVFEGNTKVTLDDLLKKEYEPYVKKSAGGPAGDNNNQQQQQQPRIPQIPSDGPKDLQTLRRMAAAANG